MTDIDLSQYRELEIDHEPDGWPAIQMREVTTLVDYADSLQAQLSAANAERDKWKARTESLANFNPDWDQLESTQDSLKEYMQLLREAKDALSEAKQKAAQQIRDRVPGDMSKSITDWPSALSTVSLLKTERNNLAHELSEARSEASIATLESLSHELNNSRGLVMTVADNIVIEKVQNVIYARAARLRQQGKGE